MTVDGIFEGTETFNMSVQTLSSAETLEVEVGIQGTAIGEIIDTGNYVAFSYICLSV